MPAEHAPIPTPASALPERQPTPEKKPRQFKKVVLGHSYRNFDRDQAIAYYFAWKAGMIPPESPVIFTAKPTPEDLTDPDVLVLEGFSSDKLPANVAQQLGNFTNSHDGRDLPAAAELFAKFSREMKAGPPNLSLLNAWFKARESNLEPAARAALLSDVAKAGLTDKLDLFTDIFYGLKATYDRDHSAMLLESITTLLDILLSDVSTEAITTAYHDERELALAQQNARRTQLESHLHNQPNRLRVSTLPTGITIALIDVRGIPGDGQGFPIARERTGADVILLVDEARNDRDEVQGTQFLIKGFDRDGSKKLDMFSLLKERLPQHEQVFGNGYLAGIEQTYGGHAGQGGVVGTPPEIGSQLSAEDMWIALHDFLRVPRYTREDFVTKTLEFAQKVGSTRFTPEIITPPTQPSKFREWQMLLHIRNSRGEYQDVTISESDLPFYEAQLSDDISSNQRLLLQKNPLEDSPDVAQKRQAASTDALTKAVAQNNVLQCLLSLDDMNKYTINSLGFATQLQLFKLICASPEAIDYIWNKDNLTFRIVSSYPDWVAQHIDNYKTERYRYLSLPTKVDSYLMENVLKAPPEQLSQVLELMFSVLESPVYKKSHESESVDFLMNNVTKAILRLPEQEKYAAWYRLRTNYPATHHAWRSLSYQTTRAVIRAFSPEAQFLVASDVATNLPIQTRHEIRRPEPEEVASNEPVTLLLEIGRPIGDNVLQNGVLDDQGKEEAVKNFAGEVRIYGTLNLNEFDHFPVVLEIIDQIKTVAKQRTGIIRLICGSLPNALVATLVAELCKLPAEVVGRIRLGHFNGKLTKFQDQRLGLYELIEE